MSTLASPQHAYELEDILPRIMRTIYRPSNADPLLDIPVAQLRMLRILYPDAKSHSAVSDDLGISVSAVTQVANRLEHLGLVERIESISDRRVKMLRLTSQGLSLMRGRQEHRIGQIEYILGQMDQHSQEQLLASLNQLLTACQSLRTEPGLVLASDLAEAGALPLLGGNQT